MSTTVALLGLGHLAGVLGRLHAAALIAPKRAHVVGACVSAPSQRRRRAARCLSAVDAPSRCCSALYDALGSLYARSQRYTGSHRRLASPGWLGQPPLAYTRSGPRVALGAREGSVLRLGPVAPAIHMRTFTVPRGRKLPKGDTPVL